MDFNKLYVHWKSLVILGFIFWISLWFLDLFGESSWRKHSDHLNDILRTEVVKLMKETTKKKEETVIPNNTFNFSYILWNIAAFICSVFFFTFARLFSRFCWVLCKFRLSSKILPNLFTKQSNLPNRLSNISIPDIVSNSTKALSTLTKIKNQRSPEKNCEIIFKNNSFAECSKVQFNTLLKVLNETKQENHELSSRILILEKENNEFKVIIEELTGVQEKLEKTTALLRNTTKSYQELNREKLTLEMDLQEITKDRDYLYGRLKKLEEDNIRLKESLEQIVEKDEKMAEEANSRNLQKKILELQQNLDNFHPPKQDYYTNSKVQLNEGNPTNDDQRGKSSHLLNYLNNQKHQDNDTPTSMSDTTCISSDENEAPCRIISSSAAFQDFMRRLNTSHYYYQKNVF